MKNWHSEKIVIDDTHLDFRENVPITELIKFFQIVTFKHSHLIGLDHLSMQKNSNAFWIVTKIKVIPYSSINAGDKINLLTWTHEPGTVRALRDGLIKKGNSIKAKFVAEWCCLDFETRRPRRISSISYPKLEMEKNKFLDIDFSNLKEMVNNSNYVYSRTIRSSDIDINNHTNNLKYNQIALDSFSVEELKSFIIKEYEIYFINETYEGDKIDVFKKKFKNEFYIEGRVEDKTVFRVVMKIKNKKESC